MDRRRPPIFCDALVDLPRDPSARRHHWGMADAAELDIEAYLNFRQEQGSLRSGYVGAFDCDANIVVHFSGGPVTPTSGNSDGLSWRPRCTLKE